MSRVAVIVADMFEDSEYTEPVAAFRRAHHEVVNVGLKAGEVVKGKKEGTPVTLDKAFGEVSVNDFDALLIPGGYSPDKLRAHDEAVAFVRRFMESGSPVFSICHGPQILITAKALAGRRLTGWRSIRQDIVNAGAEFVDQEVVRDGNLISSRSPRDLPAFIKAALAAL